MEPINQQLLNDSIVLATWINQIPENVHSALQRILALDHGSPQEETATGAEAAEEQKSDSQPTEESSPAPSAQENGQAQE